MKVGLIQHAIATSQEKTIKKTVELTQKAKLNLIGEFPTFIVQSAFPAEIGGTFKGVIV